MHRFLPTCALTALVAFSWLVAIPPALRAEHQGNLQILLLGDSTTEGSVPRRLQPDGPHLEQMIQQLLAADQSLPPCTVINSSRGGEYIRRLIDSGRYQRDASELPGIDYVLIRYGINDHAKRENFADGFPDDYRELIGLLRRDHPDAKIVLCTNIPFSSEAKTTQMNQLVRQVAESESLPLFDLHAGYAAALKSGPNMLNYRRFPIENIPAAHHDWLQPRVHDGRLEVMDNELDALFGERPGWFSDRHPNLAGYNVIAVETANYLKPLLKSDTSASIDQPLQVALKLMPSVDNPRNSEGDFVTLNDGRMLFVYTRFSGGGSDHDQAVLASRTSRDQGQTWSADDQIVVANEGDMNVMSVSLLRLADGRLGLFYLVKNSLTDCRPVVRFSNDEAVTWSDPVSIIPDSQIGYYVMNNDRVIQLQGGRLLAPVALHRTADQQSMDWKGQITCYLSDDGGLNWHRSATTQRATDADGNRIAAQEPGVVELQDGRVMLWCRSDSGQQLRCESSDGGQHWTSLQPMGIASPNSPASIQRIPGSNDLLLVWNDHSELPVSERTLRTPLTTAISHDEGVTWENVKVLYDDPDGWYCYTAIAFANDHVLLAHCAGQGRSAGLNTTQITRLPIRWLYESSK
ncbi:exo-alpha-sialidase [Stieleria sp. TO1_6]|uniref:exo-alpha-sialidase n=1 Tax=Stieleria tagensis TaxID=2956795 RepID=UPI00209B9092|nr:exo-alpha-sialidase [Stieleria tagensis]MCO8121070.1 exo-alpha-sialidase [Stieleria tagensis]